MLRDVCIGLFLLVSTLAVPALATDTASDLAQDDSNTVAPVTLDGEVLFRLRGTPALPAWYRAQEVRELQPTHKNGGAATGQALRHQRLVGGHDHNTTKSLL